MDSYTALKLGELNRGNPMKVFDWYKAAAIIKTFKVKNAWAGLGEDWTFTGGQIYKDGKPYHDDYTYLASTWATPVIVIDTEDIFECWCWEYECEWDAHTKWPELAEVYIEETNGRIC